MATSRAARSVLLSVLVGLLSLYLTGCDTLQSADSSPSASTPTPPPSAYHQVSVTVPPKAAPITPAPAPAPVVPPVEKPIARKPAETPSPAPTPLRPVEAKPTPPQPPAKGAETLVALSTVPPPRTSESVSASQKPARASAPNTDNVAPASEPQALFFKGPERPPPQPGHKFLWLGLGLGVCAAAGGGVTWFRINRKREITLALPVKKQSDDEVDLPREFKVKERRIFVEEKEPATTEKS